MQRRGKAAFPSAFDLVCAYIRSAAGAVRFRSPLQPVSALPLLHIWYENSCEFCPPPPSGVTKRPRSASTAFDRAKAVGKRARAMPVTHSLSAPAILMLPALCKELPAGFFAAFDLVCAYIRSAAGAVRFRFPLQPVSALPLLHIWYENSCEFCPKPHRRAAAAARSTPNRKPRSA